MKRGLYYFGGGYVPPVNDLRVAAATLDGNEGADPVTFEQPGLISRGSAGAIMRQAEREALLDQDD